MMNPFHFPGETHPGRVVEKLVSKNVIQESVFQGSNHCSTVGFLSALHKCILNLKGVNAVYNIMGNF